ncbi:hypothetical protein FA10DRAFT_269934 [Acaromyces ingoldii]|uniref:Uncharacterized protein n=1 Tax=Acaromyces ingoldii TaxID=215250 RepID=A0A316YB32_9BASI|nr:hypothetical protein FA10DRAFT_269934 [Acaromyces ingoldii]PWN86836.1 hypothetical protein FA10DRAFT_269934 [Acaromyces ingoldii]
MAEPGSQPKCGCKPVGKKNRYDCQTHKQKVPVPLLQGFVPVGADDDGSGSQVKTLTLGAIDLARPESNQMNNQIFLFKQSRSTPVWQTDRLGGEKPTKVGHTCTFEVLLYRGIARSQAGQQPKALESELFVYTGNCQPVIMSDKFMRFEDLRDRLSYQSAANQYSADFDLVQNAQQNGKLPFELWDPDGNPITGLKVYKHFFDQAKLCDQASKGFVSDINKQFLAYCSLAAAASRAPPKPFSVMARFWDLNFRLEVGITLSENTAIAEVIGGGKGGGGAKKGGGKSSRKEFLTARAAQALKDLKVADPSQLEIVPRRENEHTELLGAHPSMFYQLYVSKAAFKELQREGLYKPERTFKPNAVQVCKNAQETLVQGKSKDDMYPVVTFKEAEVVDSTITLSKLHSAKSGSRKTVDSQNAVMNGIGAPEIATLLWKEQDKGQRSGKLIAEWLHRSAFSYGGLKGTLASSQVQENLIFGSSETNTMMIRYEEWIKELVRTGNNMRLTTTLRRFPKVDKKGKSGWLCERMEYACTLRTTKAVLRSGLTAAANPAVLQIFRPFGRCFPSRAEIKIDKYVNSLLLPPKDDD